MTGQVSVVLYLRTLVPLKYRKKKYAEGNCPKDTPNGARLSKKRPPLREAALKKIIKII